MKKFIALSLVIFLNSCAITRVGEIIPGKMYSVDSDKVMDFGIELVLVATGGGSTLEITKKTLTIRATTHTPL